MGKNITATIKKAGISLILGSALGLTSLCSQWKWEVYSPNPNAKRVSQIVKQNPNKYIQKSRIYQKKMSIDGLGEVQATYFDDNEYGIIGKGDRLRVVIKGFWNDKKYFEDYNLDGLTEIKVGSDMALMPEEDYQKYENDPKSHGFSKRDIVRFCNESYNNTLRRIIDFVEKGK